jgi:AcrR family transcriptional regulator
MPKGFTEQEKAWIRQRLTEQGYRLFSTYGLKKTTVEELSEAAGISKGAFYLFYDSKEALFMHVAEETAEKRFRREVMQVVDLPGPSPRARLLVILQKIFSLFQSTPMLQYFSGSDYNLLLRRIPPEKLQQHLAGDLAFFQELIARCRLAGIPIQVPPEEIMRLLYVLVLGVMHRDDFGSDSLGGAMDVFLQLIAAYCLGEVALTNPGAPGAAQPAEVTIEP